MRLPRQALLDGLRAFSVAARQLSFKAAADALFVTPSAISHRIRDLERHLGQRVFVRKTRAVELTDAGRELLEEVEPLLAGLDAALDHAADRARRRRLRVAAPTFLATDLLIPSLRSFYGMQPRIDLELLTAPQLAEHGAHADISIVIAPGPPPAQIATRLFSPRFVAATARPVAMVARELGNRVFEKHRRIVYRHRAELWTRWFATTGFPGARSATVLNVDTLPAAIGAAEQGLGITLVPTFVCERRLRRGRLVRISDAEVESGDAYFLVHRHEDRARPEVRAFLSWALTELRR
ncbi:MAG: LysR family transcriptional regulator [Proteobacteria bacterium]|nr:LysR family transcriptional regulator [Pseudomonadota bacterium]